MFIFPKIAKLICFPRIYTVLCLKLEALSPPPRVQTAPELQSMT